MSNIKNEIKLLLIHCGISMTELIDKINEKYDRKDTVQNLNNKLARGTIKYSEIKEIAEILNYNLAWIPKDKSFLSINDGIFYSTSIDEIKHKQKGKPFIPSIVTSQTKIERTRIAAKRGFVEQVNDDRFKFMEEYSKNDTDKKE